MVIWDSHTNIVSIRENGVPVFEAAEDKERESDSPKEETAVIYACTLEQLVRYTAVIPLDEIAMIRDAFPMNLALLREGLESERITLGFICSRQTEGSSSARTSENGVPVVKWGDRSHNASLSKSAMSITGSGAYGIITTMPLFAAYRARGYAEEALIRATALSFLVYIYIIKEYSGNLSAFCGCSIAAGTGIA